jgi:2,3-dihydroxy-p-cumate/2,3-dihydroxybenzoate 3,4-dioxygenase
MIRFRRLGRVELDVTDVARSQAFYRDIVGLRAVHFMPGGAVLMACGADDGCSVVLHPSARAGLRSVGWELQDAGQIAAAVTALQSADCPFLLSNEASHRHPTIITEDPGSGAVHQLYVREIESRGTAGSGHTKIQRLGHVVLATPTPETSVKFFCETLGFRESDRIEGRTTFLRPFPTRFHHGLGIAQADRPRFHHVNLMVTEIDDIGRALHRLRSNSVRIVFGPGRHPVSGSVFLYFLDPDGLTVEYSFGMEEFEEVEPRTPRQWPAEPSSVDTWGAQRDPMTGAHGDIVRLTRR